MSGSLGIRLRELRKKKKLTQIELAKKLNLNQVSISGYERGTRLPDTDILSRMADILDTSTDYLLGKTNNPKKDDISVHYLERENLTDEDIEYINTMIEALKRKTRDKER